MVFASTLKQAISPPPPPPWGRQPAPNTHPPEHVHPTVVKDLPPCAFATCSRRCDLKACAGAGVGQEPKRQRFYYEEAHASSSDDVAEDPFTRDGLAGNPHAVPWRDGAFGDFMCPETPLALDEDLMRDSFQFLWDKADASVPGGGIHHGAADHHDAP